MSDASGISPDWDGKSKLTSVNDLLKAMAKSKGKHRALDFSSSAKTTRASFRSLCTEKAAGPRLDFQRQ